MTKVATKSKYKNEFEAFFHRDMEFKILSDPLQYDYVKAILAPTEEIQAVFSDSPSGTGKSSLALASAYYLLHKKKINTIAYIRNTVSVRDNGFLPGTIEDKERAYMKPAEDNINRIARKLGIQSENHFQDLITDGKLICTTTSFMRGIDYEDDMVFIIDEAQNLELTELRTVLTRPHDNVKTVVIGSSLQVDNPKIKYYGKDKLLPFQVYQEHFMNQKKFTVESIDLKNNYRGDFAQYADNIHSTINKINNQL